MGGAWCGVAWLISFNGNAALGPGAGNILHVCIQNIIFAEIVSLKKKKKKRRKRKVVQMVQLVLPRAKQQLPLGMPVRVKL